VKGGAYTYKEVKLAAEMWRDGYTLREIARATDRSMNSISGYVSKHRDLFPRRRPVITTKMIGEMREMRNNGKSYEKIALHFGIDWHTVHKYVNYEGDELWG
jgi:transposase